MLSNTSWTNICVYVLFSIENQNFISDKNWFLLQFKIWRTIVYNCTIKLFSDVKSKKLWNKSIYFFTIKILQIINQENLMVDLSCFGTRINFQITRKFYSSTKIIFEFSNIYLNRENFFLIEEFLHFLYLFIYIYKGNNSFYFFKIKIISYFN